MKYLYRYLLIILFLSTPAISFAQWVDFMTITDDYFENRAGVVGDQRMVLVFDASFHACGTNNMADIRMAKVGPDLYKTLTSVVLAAWMGNRKLSVFVNGCADDRANVTALRIDK